MSALNSYEIKFQRELNRTHESSRQLRKKGLEILLSDIPWPTKSDKKTVKKSETNIEELNYFIEFQLLPKVVIRTLNDPVEKCRETSLQLLLRSLKDSDILIKDQNIIEELIMMLCNRINSIPFQESAEELRLLIVDSLNRIVMKEWFKDIKQVNLVVYEAIVDSICNGLVKVLTDNFPAVKREGAELVCRLTESKENANSLKKVMKPLLKSLVGNALHQHSKTRVITLRAIGFCLVQLTDSNFEEVIIELSIISIFTKCVNDHTPSVRVELCQQLSSILASRFTFYCTYPFMEVKEVNYELYKLLVLLCGDDTPEVSQEALKCLTACHKAWLPNHPTSTSTTTEDSSKLIENAEMELQSIVHEDGMTRIPIQLEDTDKLKAIPTHRSFFIDHFGTILNLLLEGSEGWSLESKIKHMKGLQQFIQLVNSSFDRAFLTRTFHTLGITIRDDEYNMRVATEHCCSLLGGFVSVQDTLDLILPKILGDVPGGDTAHQRAVGLRLLTHLLQGFPNVPSTSVTPLDYVLSMTSCLAQTKLYEYREAFVREAVILLNRSMIETFPTLFDPSDPLDPSMDINIRNMTLSLVFLMGRCPGDGDEEAELIIGAARDLLDRLSRSNRETLLEKHFDFILDNILNYSVRTTTQKQPLQPQSQQQDRERIHPNWVPKSPEKAAFEVMLRECPRKCWQQHDLIVSIIRYQVQPSVAPLAGSSEANALMYAAQRGEEVIPTHGEVDVRLTLLATLEGWIRSGSSDWTCGSFIAASTETIIQHILVPNLIWRVGRVEATVRKVSLAITNALMKAGAISTDTLLKCAGELVPLLVSHLDDMEVSPRHMACLALTVMFDRLRGYFGEQSIREIYPKLIARLDDSHDAVRTDICRALEKFFQCGMTLKEDTYSNTTVDYSLDQLFIHLDDSDESIQAAVCQVILVISQLNKKAVLKKAELNRLTHRTPKYCDKIIFEVQGFEILEDSK